jgi:hypothetical protein
VSPRRPHAFLGLLALSACSSGTPPAGAPTPPDLAAADAAQGPTSPDSRDAASVTAPDVSSDVASDDVTEPLDALPDAPSAGPAPADDAPPGGSSPALSSIDDAPADEVSPNEPNDALGPRADEDGGLRDGTLPGLARDADDAAALPDTSTDTQALVGDAVGDIPTDASSADAWVDAPTDADDAAAAIDAGDGSPVTAVVVPTLQGGHYLFASGHISFEVDPAVGGRVVSFALDGQNVLTGPDANATNYGSTFWTSPQSDWGWPPPPEIDNLPYAASIDGGTLSLRGAPSAPLGVAVTKASSFDVARGAIAIAYTVRNVGPAPRSLAPWEVTRVRYGGLVLFPAGQPAFSADGGPPLATQDASGATWFDAGPAPPGANAKLFADAPRGWIAQEIGGLLFVKKFPTVARGLDAPGEATIEIYASGDRAYIEIENQGAFGPIAAGGSVTWQTIWFLTKVPPAEDGGLGSSSLVATVDAL